MEHLERELRKDLSVRTRKAKNLMVKPKGRDKVLIIENLFSQWANVKRQASPQQVKWMSIFEEAFRLHESLTDKQMSIMKNIIERCNGYIQTT
jgi:hypothetical protein